MATLEFKFKVGGVLTNATSVVLSDPNGVYGVKRMDTGTVLVAADTPMANADTGVYRYDLTEPAVGLVYSWWVEVVHDGTTYHFEREFIATGGSGSDAAAYVLERLGNIQTLRSGAGTVSAAVAVDTELARHADKADPRLWALAELWDRYANTIDFESESTGDYTYSKATAEKKAAKYLEQAKAADAAAPDAAPPAGTFVSVPIVRGGCSRGDGHFCDW